MIYFKLTYDDSNLICFKLNLHIFLSLCASKMFRRHWLDRLILSLSEMGNLNLKLWNAARDGDKDRVVAAISAGADKNWKNEDRVSDNDM